MLVYKTFLQYVIIMPTCWINTTPKCCSQNTSQILIIDLTIKKVSTDPIFTADHEYIFFQRDSDLTLCCVVQRNAHMLPVFFQNQHTCAYTSPLVDVHHVHAVGSMVEIFAVSEDIAAPWVLSRLLSANRTIPDMTSANQPRVQIHDAVFN